MLNFSKSSILNLIFLLFLGFILVSIVALIVTNMGDKEEKLGLKTLHKSTFNKISSSLTSSQAIFYDSKRIVIAEDQFKNSNIFFVNLEKAEVKKISLDTDKDLVIREFIPLEDRVIALYYSDLEHGFAYMVDKDGNIDKMQYFDSGNEHESVKDKIIEDFISQNSNIKLTRIKLESVNSKSDTRGFFGENTFFSCYNPITCQTFDLLKRKSTKDEAIYKFEVDNDFEHKGYTIKLTRDSDKKEHTELDSSAFAWVRKVQIYKNNNLVKEYPLTKLYSAIIPVGDRIYFVGHNVRYVELSELINP